MNDETRAALVDDIAKRIDTFAEHVGYGDLDVTRDEAESYIAEIEEALLADRATVAAEPDADAVERVAKAIYDEDMKGYEDDFVLPWTVVKARWVRVARSAITAMPSAPTEEGDWLDDALNSVHPKAYVNGIKPFDGGWIAWIMWPDRRGDIVRGTGPTRKAAVLDAVAKARKEAQQ